ncbi:MAG: hypothetical protein Q9164_000405 [Protoblastenia rupestris]
MVLHNPNNWHWVNKDVREWARQYLDENLLGLEAEQGDASAKVSKIMSMDGDVDVSQRKGKVITLFDVKLQLEYEGSTKEEEDVSGSITIPEVAHDTEEDEYVFDIDIYSDSSAKQPVKDLVRSKIVPQLRTKLAQLGPALITEHGKDLQHAAGAEPALQSTKVTSSSNISQTNAKTTTTSTAPAQKTSATSANGSSVNTVEIKSTEEFRTTAQELYTTFTSPDRLAAFTRAPPTIYEGAQPGGKFSLFGGNVSGSYISLTEPTKIVQKWRLGSWPEGHYSVLEINFDQNDRDAVTVMRVVWKALAQFCDAAEQDTVTQNQIAGDSSLAV